MNLALSTDSELHFLLGSEVKIQVGLLILKKDKYFLPPEYLIFFKVGKYEFFARNFGVEMEFTFGSGAQSAVA